MSAQADASGEMEASAEMHLRSVQRVSSIREEMRFEIGILHDRINALISAQAFLLISFTMALVYAGSRWGDKFFFVAPILSVIGFMLSALAWPGISTSYRAVVAWNVILVRVLNEASADPKFIWTPSLLTDGERRIQADHRNGLLFARFIPVVFAVAWVVLATVVLTAPLR